MNDNQTRAIFEELMKEVRTCVVNRVVATTDAQKAFSDVSTENELHATVDDIFSSLDYTSKVLARMTRAIEYLAELTPDATTRGKGDRKTQENDTMGITKSLDEYLEQARDMDIDEVARLLRKFDLMYPVRVFLNEVVPGHVYYMTQAGKEATQLVCIENSAGPVFIELGNIDAKPFRFNDEQCVAFAHGKLSLSPKQDSSGN